MKNEPWDAEDYKDRPEMLKLLLMLDGHRYRSLFGRPERPVLKPTEKAQRSWKGGVKLVGKDYR
jgi:hypothetical protein